MNKLGLDVDGKLISCDLFQSVLLYTAAQPNTIECFRVLRKINPL